MYALVSVVLVLTVVFPTTPTGQLTNIAGSTSISVSPNDATCGRTSTDHYCRVDIAGDAGCVDETCRTECQDKGPTYRDLLREVSGFNYDGRVTNTTKYFDGDDVTVAVFNRAGRLAFLRGTVNITTPEEFTLTFRVRPDQMETESSVIDLHGSGHLQRVFNVRIGLDLGVTIVSGLTHIKLQTWTITRHAWTHIAVQFRQNRVKVFLNGTDESESSAVLKLQRSADMSHVNMKIGQTFAGDLSQTHIVEEQPPIQTNFCEGRDTTPFMTHACYCNMDVTSTGIPGIADFCQHKMDGWYSQPPIGYTQCRDGRVANHHNCKSVTNAEFHSMRSTLLQCTFCSASCRCEVNCTGGNANEGCDALAFVCRDGEQKVHPKYCDEYYLCVKGIYVRKECAYPDRWSVKHRRCDRFQYVSCGARIPKNHPCDREVTYFHGYSPPCNLMKHPATCMGRKDGLHYKPYLSSPDMCGIFGCINETLITLTGNGIIVFDTTEHYRETYALCGSSQDGINPATGVCEAGAPCPKNTTSYVPNSPYMWCTDGDVSTSRYDCRDYWRCEHGEWTWQRCPEGLVWSDKKQCVSDIGQCMNRWLLETQDTKERQFLGQLADFRLYDVVLSEREIQKLNGINCTTWRRDAHPVEFLVDSNSSTFWLSRPRLDPVDLLFDLQGTYKLEEISMTFFGPVPLVVSIFKKVMTEHSWQLWRVFRDDCRDISKCTELGNTKLDNDQLTLNLLDMNLGPLQRRASTLRFRLSGHRVDQVRNISYFGIYKVTINRRKSSRCGSHDFLEHESSRTCLPCDCDIDGVIDGDVGCNEVGGQCSCKRYVMGRRCNRCLLGYSSIRENDTDGCSESVPETTAASFVPKTSPASNSEDETTMLVDHEVPSASLWYLYTVPVYALVVVIIVVVIIVVTIEVICVRIRRRRQQRDSGEETDNPPIQRQPTYEQPATIEMTPTYNLPKRQNSAYTAKGDPDYIEIN